MNVVRHDYVTTHSDVGLFLCALGKKNERSVDLILCQEPVSFMCAERHEVKRTCCEDPSKTLRSPPESRLHARSVAKALRAVQSEDAVPSCFILPAIGRWLQISSR